MVLTVSRYFESVLVEADVSYLLFIVPKDCRRLITFLRVFIYFERILMMVIKRKINEIMKMYPELFLERERIVFQLRTYFVLACAQCLMCKNCILLFFATLL